MEAAYRKKHGSRKPTGVKDFATPLLDKWDMERLNERKAMQQRFEALLGEPKPARKK
jgi:hypothetical protein